jgi:hypothetical protein
MAVAWGPSPSFAFVRGRRLPPRFSVSATTAFVAINLLADCIQGMQSNRLTANELLGVKACLRQSREERLLLRG